MVYFGPSGNDESFYNQGFKSSLEAPKWLHGLGLNAIEINFARGVKLGEVTAKRLGEEARKYGIAISAHAPYYINLASPEADKIKKSYDYIAGCLKALEWINAGTCANRLVVHVGSTCSQPRKVAIENCHKNLAWVVHKLKKENFKNFILCIEVLGRYGQIGNLQEICELCGIDDSIIPTIDFGHINCLEQGELKRNPNRITEIMEYCHKRLGDKINKLHIHWSAIKYTAKGEHAHTVLGDEPWEFSFEPLAKYIKQNNLEPTIISESKGTQASDSVTLKDIFSQTK